MVQTQTHPPNPPQGGNSTETSHYLINIPIFILNSTALPNPLKGGIRSPRVLPHLEYSPIFTVALVSMLIRFTESFR